MAEGGSGPGREKRPVEEMSEAELRSELEELRDRIVAADDELIRLVGTRKELVLRIGRLKEALGMPILDPSREARVVRRAARRAREIGVDEELVRDVIWRIIAGARRAQEGERGWGPPEYPPPDLEGGDADDG